MKIRYLISAICAYVTYSIFVCSNVLSRVLSGYSVFSSEPSLNWLGSWQAVGLLLVVSVGLLMVVGIYLGWHIAQTVDEMKPKQRKRFVQFLVSGFRLLWLARKGKPDKFSQAINTTGKLFPELVKK